MANAPHLNLGLSRDLWQQILGAALPFEVGTGTLDLAASVASGVRALCLKERVAGLLEAESTPAPLQRLGAVAGSWWQARREVVLAGLRDLVAVQGTWRVEIDGVGTELGYGPQRVTADAFVRGVAEGQITFLRDNVTLPFRIEQRLGASVSLARIRYARERDAVIGNVSDLALHLGDSAVLQLLSRLLEAGLAMQVEGMDAVTLLPRGRVEEMVGGLGGGLGVQLGVDDLELAIDEERMELRVRFGFARAPSAPALTEG